MSVEKSQFNVIKYTTKDGENITATKQGNTVTLVGDKNGVRQMPLNKFMQEFVQNVPQINNGQPVQDTVSFSGQPDKTIEGAKNSKKGLLAGLGLLLLAGGAYVLSGGRSSKAAKAAQEAGQEIIEQGSKKGQKVVQEVVEEVLPKGQKVVQEVAEEVTPKGQKVVQEVVEEVAPKGQKVVPKGQKVVQEVAEEAAPKGKQAAKETVEKVAEKTGEKAKKTSKSLPVEAVDDAAKEAEEAILKQQAIDELRAMGLFVDDLKPANYADEIIDNTSKVIDDALKPKTASLELPKQIETPEIKIPRQAFERGSDDVVKVADDLVDDIANKGTGVIEEVADEGAEAAGKLFGDNTLTGLADDATGVVDDVLHTPKTFLDDVAESTDDMFRPSSFDGTGDLMHHTDDMFKPYGGADDLMGHTDDMFKPYGETDDLLAHTDDVFDNFGPGMDDGLF